MKFIAEELRPFPLHATGRSTKSRQTLMGHAYAGLYVLHAMFAAPEHFHNLIAAWR